MDEALVGELVPWDADSRLAVDRFRVDIVEAPRRNLVVRSLALVATAIVTLGAGPTNPGGRHANIIEIISGQVVGTTTELMGDDEGGFGQVVADLERLDVAAFARRWLDAIPG